LLLSCFHTTLPSTAQSRLRRFWFHSASNLDSRIFQDLT
jgi:hypothetical protein